MKLFGIVKYMLVLKSELYVYVKSRAVYIVSPDDHIAVATFFPVVLFNTKDFPLYVTVRLVVNNGYAYNAMNGPVFDIVGNASYCPANCLLLEVSVASLSVLMSPVLQWYAPLNRRDVVTYTAAWMIEYVLLSVNSVDVFMILLVVGSCKRNALNR